MAKEISMNGRKKIERIQKEFTEKFNYLTLIFLDENMKSINVSRSLAEVRTAKGPDISIMASLKVNTLEQRFKDSFGITVEVAYLKNGKVMHTKDSVNKTLNELNRWCEKNGCDIFLFKKALTRNTLLSTQEQLFNAIRETFPDAEVKKINKDNFMDIHIPSIHPKRGTHLFFNTANNDIKLGFYVRDEDFINRVMANATNIEQYAQGLRILGNPTFPNVDKAFTAAMEFIEEMMGDAGTVNKKVTNPVIKKFISEFNNNPEPICELLDLLAPDAGKMNVYTVEIDVLSKLGVGDLPEVYELELVGEVEIDDWSGLSKFIGIEEAEANKKEYANDSLNENSKIVFLYCEGEYVYSFLNPGEEEEEDNGESFEKEMQKFLDDLEIDESDSDEKVDQNQADSYDVNDETDDLSKLIIKEIPSKNLDAKCFEVNGKYTFTLGYDTNAYVNEDVVGIVPDERILEALNSGELWSDFIWNNGWSELDSKVHNHGIVEPATHLELPNGEKVEIKINSTTPEFDKQKVALYNSVGKFIHISNSAEKAYGWEQWKKYKVNFGPGIFDTSKIHVNFSDDIVSGYFYDFSDTDSLDFYEDESYETSGIGFSSELFFNNGKELILIDLEELVGKLEENDINKDNIDDIRNYLFGKNSDHKIIQNKNSSMATKKSTSTKKTSSSDSIIKSVKIGKQIWMAENLNVDKFRNGDSIPEAKTAEEWERAGKSGQPAWCYYENKNTNGKKYGKLYNWFAVNDPRGLAPEGWHIPSEDEWTRLSDFLGGEAVASKKIKSTEGWRDDINTGKSGNGTNESGFNAMPGGYRFYSAMFNGIGFSTKWWTSSEDYTDVWTRGLSFNEDSVDSTTQDKDHGLSVRCLKD